MIMAKKFWSYVITGLKGLAVSIITYIPVGLLSLFIIWIMATLPALALILGIVAILLYSMIWGWVANKLFKWN
jgi:hypothetical protein